MTLQCRADGRPALQAVTVTSDSKFWRKRGPRAGACMQRPNEMEWAERRSGLDSSRQQPESRPATVSVRSPRDLPRDSMQVSRFERTTGGSGKRCVAPAALAFDSDHVLCLCLLQAGFQYDHLLDLAFNRDYKRTRHIRLTKKSTLPFLISTKDGFFFLNSKTGRNISLTF